MNLIRSSLCGPMLLEVHRFAKVACQFPLGVEQGMEKVQLVRKPGKHGSRTGVGIGYMFDQFSNAWKIAQIDPAVRHLPPLTSRAHRSLGRRGLRAYG